MTFKVFLEKIPHYIEPTYRLYVGMRMENGRMVNVERPVFRSLDESAAVSSSDAFLDDSINHTDHVRSFLQAMSDAAWEIGIRPKQLESHANELTAVRYHLEDMRGLALAKK